MLGVRDGSIWNRTLFVVPSWIKVAFRLLTASIVVVVILGMLYMIWKNYKGFSLIGPATGIPGWIVLAELHLFALLGLIAAFRLFRDQGFEAGGGASFGCISLLCNPNKLSGVRGEEYADFFPILFWFCTLVLAFQIGVLFWRRTMAKALSTELASEGVR